MSTGNPFEPPRAQEPEWPAGDAQPVDAAGVRELVRTVPLARRCAYLAVAAAILCAVSAGTSLGGAAPERRTTLVMSLGGLVATLWLRAVFAAFVRQGRALAAGDLRALEGALRAVRAFFRGIGVFILLTLVAGVVLGYFAVQAGG